jgi:RTX calcium-binding nonapeptide repeat (4 copies)
MLRGDSSKRHMPREGEGAVVRQGRSIAVVVAFLIGCAVHLVAGCAGVGSKAPQKEKARSPEATASDAEARCEGTRTVKSPISGDKAVYTTNDLPGCPKGGLLKGTDKPDLLDGKHGDDEVRGLGGSDRYLEGGPGNDILYGGAEFDVLVSDTGDDVLYGGDGNDELVTRKGDDVLYGGDGNDFLMEYDGQRDKLYCGEGKDVYLSDKNNYVDSSCEKKAPPNYGTA